MRPAGLTVYVGLARPPAVDVQRLVHLVHGGGEAAVEQPRHADGDGAAQTPRVQQRGGPGVGGGNRG